MESLEAVKDSEPFINVVTLFYGVWSLGAVKIKNTRKLILIFTLEHARKAPQGSRCVAVLFL
jgi:hypothetical protein